MAPACTSVHEVEETPKYGCHQCLCLLGELHPLPASLGDAPKQAGRSGLGSYKITAIALGPGACEILFVPFKSEVSTFLSCVRLPKVNPTGIQSQILWEFVSLVQDPGLRTVITVGVPLQCNYSSVLGQPPGGMGLDYITNLPLLPVFLWFLLCVFVLEDLFWSFLSFSL